MPALLLALLIAGCKKQHEASNESSSLAALEPAGSPGSNSPTGVVISDTSDINRVLHELSLELRRYVVRTHSVPKNFEEFAAKSQAQIPAPPDGKKYAIQGQVVVLVRR
jgi:hypothetical protein